MHVDVDESRIDAEPKRVSRLPVVVQHVAVRLAQRMGKHAIADEAAVDKNVLCVARRRRVGRPHSPSGKLKLGRLFVHLRRVACEGIT